MSTQGRSARGKDINGMVENEGVANHPAMCWAESIKQDVKNSGDSPRKGEEQRRKEILNEEQQNEEHRQMKIKNEDAKLNEDQK